MRYRTGNTATITLTGTLTTGVTTAWSGHVKSIDPGEWTRGERDVSLLADAGFLRRDPHDLMAPNDVSGVILFSPLLGVPTGINIDTVTITLPQEGTATSGITRAAIAGKAWFSRIKFPELQNNETMTSEFTLAMTGEDLAYTPEGAT